MNKNESIYYSPEEIRKIQERGVQIPDLRSVLIAREVKPENILTHKDEIRTYETDALTAYRQTPLLVTLPETVNEVSRIVKYCN